MWIGGVRVIVLDDNNRILMVRQAHPERDVWMVPGGQIEEGETSYEAGIREVKEETGLDIEVKSLLWHVEETGERGQRFVNFYLAKPASEEAGRGIDAGTDDGSGKVVPELGSDPELKADEQVLREIRFMAREEIEAIENLYPAWLRDEFWDKLKTGELKYDAFRKREESH